MLEVAICTCTFEGTLLTVVVSWLTIDGCVLRKTRMTHIWQKVLVKRDIGNIWDKRSNGTYDFVYSVSIIFKSAVDERLIDQGGAWNGSTEVKCKYFRMSGFGIVLLSLWTCWGAWVQRNIFCGF